MSFDVTGENLTLWS